MFKAVQNINSEWIAGKQNYDLIMKRMFEKIPKERTPKIGTWALQRQVLSNKEAAWAQNLAEAPFMKEVVTLLPEEKLVVGKFDRLMRHMGRRLNLPKEKLIKDYYTMAFTEKVAPRDMLQTMAAQLAKDDGLFGGIEIAANLPKSEVAVTKFQSLSPEVQGQYFERARVVLKSIPKEIWYGPTSAPRSGAATGVITDIEDTTRQYVHGSLRKIYLDKTRNEIVGNVAKLGDPSLRNYALDYFDQIKGVLTDSERITTMRLSKMVEEAEAGGYLKIAKAAKMLVPRVASAKLRALQFNAKIGGNLFSPFQNIVSQTGLNTTVEFGVPKVFSAVKEYAGMGVHSREQISKLLTAAGIKYTPHIGTVDLTSDLSKKLGWLFSQSEDFNRGVAFLAGYRQYLDDLVTAGKTTKGAIPLAIKAGRSAVDKTQFIYSRVNMPFAFESPGGAVAMQFKSYTWNQLHWLKKVMTEGTPAQKFRLVTLGMLLGGVKSWLPISLSAALISKLKETDTDDWIQSMITGGVPRTLGIDIGESMGTSVFPNVSQLTDDPRQFFGPTISTAYNLLKGSAKAYPMLKEGDPAAKEELKRELIRNVPGGVQGLRLFQAGDALLNEKGQDILLSGKRERPLVEYSTKDAILHGILGARTTAVTKEIEKAQFLTKEKESYTNKKTEIEDNLLELYEKLKTQPTHRGTISQLIVKQTMEAMELGITPTELSKKLQQRYRELAPRLWKTMPNELKAKLLKTNPKLVAEILNQEKEAVRRASERAYY